MMLDSHARPWTSARHVTPRFRFRARNLVAAGCLAITVVAGSVGVAAPAHAATIYYAALGDSYSSGVGADGYAAASGTCYRGSHAYPVLWAAAHTTSGFDFAACAGATTDTVRSGQLGGLSANTTLVTISVGGNDVGFAGLLTTCLITSEAACASAVAQATSNAQTVLPGKLASTYADIRAAAPNARLVVLGYPRLFELTSCALGSMSLANRTVLNNGADSLAEVIKGQATASGATYVDVRSNFAGHGVCASTPWINGLVLIPSQNSYHPLAAGYSQGYLPALIAITG